MGPATWCHQPAAGGNDVPTSLLLSKKRPKFRVQSTILTECTLSSPSESCKSTHGSLCLRDHLHIILKVYKRGPREWPPVTSWPFLLGQRWYAVLKEISKFQSCATWGLLCGSLSVSVSPGRAAEGYAHECGFHCHPGVCLLCLLPLQPYWHEGRAKVF